VRSQESGVSPDEKIFTPTDERGFFPHTPHPTPYTLFPVRRQERIFKEKAKKKDSKVKICLFPVPYSLFPVPFSN
jgi:hypothetical protein